MDLFNQFNVLILFLLLTKYLTLIQFIFIKVNLILIYWKKLHLLLLHKYRSFLRCSIKLWLFHVHPLFQNTHLSSSFCGHFYAAAQVHITIPHLLTKQSVTEICVFTFYFWAHKYTIFPSLLTVLHNKMWTTVISICHFKAQLPTIFHTEVLTLLIFIHQMNGDTGLGLSNKM